MYFVFVRLPQARGLEGWGRDVGYRKTKVDIWLERLAFHPLNKKTSASQSEIVFLLTPKSDTLASPELQTCKLFSVLQRQNL